MVGTWLEQPIFHMSCSTERPNVSNKPWRCLEHSLPRPLLAATGPGRAGTSKMVGFSEAKHGPTSGVLVDQSWKSQKKQLWEDE